MFCFIYEIRSLLLCGYSVLGGCRTILRHIYRFHNSEIQCVPYQLLISVPYQFNFVWVVAVCVDKILEKRIYSGMIYQLSHRNAVLSAYFIRIMPRSH